MNRVSWAKHLKKELEDRHGTSDPEELKRRGIAKDEVFSSTQEEDARDIAKEQSLSKEEQDALASSQPELTG
jgi:tRNA uridine 5-carbamoylmethylation protein Kti12